MKNRTFAIGEWSVDPTSNLLINKDIERRIEPKVMALLVFLANADGAVVSRDSILDSVWQRVVLDDVITNTIANLRKALGDTKTPRRFIETIPKQGYRLISDVSWDDEVAEGRLAARSTQHTRRSGDAGLVQFGRKVLANKLALFVLLGVTVLAASLIRFPDGSPQLTELEASTPKTIAILPFFAHGEQAETRYFADGLTDELIHQLATNPDLRVIARTSSSKFEGTNKGIKEISELLGADFIIEGSIRQSAGILRITVQLIDANKQTNLWSKTFDNKTDDNILDTQTEISKNISRTVTNQDPIPEQHAARNHPESAEAYKHFVLGQSYMKLADPESLEKALESYRKATEIAPDYALAYTGMALAKTLLYQYKHTSLEETKLEVNKSLRKALAIEPDLAEAYAVRGLLGIYLREYEQSEIDFKKAIALNPGLRIARHNYGFLLSQLSRYEDALVQTQLALEMDPLSPITNFGLGSTLTSLGEIEKAIEQFVHCQRVVPESTGCPLGLAAVYSLLGDAKKQGENLALVNKLQQRSNFWQIASTALHEIFLGHWDKARILVSAAEEQRATDYFLLKTDFTLNLHLSSVSQYIEKLKLLSVENPSDHAVNLMLGMSLYSQSDCKLSIKQYEQAARTNDEMTLGVWGFQQGISHNLNLAYCYSQRNDFIAAEERLEQFDEFVRSLPDSRHIMPGKLYSQARYLVLTGKPLDARQVLSQIEDWPLFWIAEKDPVLSDLFEYTENTQPF